jgi:uncharacterized sulfatase
MPLSRGNRRTKLSLGVAAAVALGLAGALLPLPDGPLRFPTERPPTARGVVLLLASGFAGDRTLPQTPALAGLAAVGRRFEKAFAASSDVYLARTAVLRDLPEAFHAQGARVARVGTGPGPARRSAWDLSLPGAITEPTVQARLEEWLSQEPTGCFLLVASLGPTPGAPRDEPPTPEPDLRAPRLPRIASNDLGFRERPGSVVEPPMWTDQSRKRAEAASLADARAADGDLERALEFLQRAAPDGELAIVVLGDPHPDLGQHGLLVRPDALFDTTLRMDLVVTAPGLPRPGRGSPALVSSADVTPTLLDLAGYPPSAAPGSTSLVPLLASPDPRSSREVVSSVRRRAGGVGRSLRTARHRYTEWPDGSEELYDHARDPHEHVNLAGHPEARSTVESLRQVLATGRRPPVVTTSASAAVARPRNVLLILIDDLNTQVGAWGSTVLTPNLDRLARRGVRFEHAYVQVAMCSPSRVSFMTGWRPERTGVWNNRARPRPAAAVPLQEHFGAHGHFTASIGKVLHRPELFRWDWRDRGSPAPTPQKTAAVSDQRTGEEAWTRAEGDDASQPDGMRARAAAGLLRQPREHPFFLAVGFVRPHTKWIAPARYFDLYDPQAVTLPPVRDGDLADVPAIAIKTRPQVLPGLALQGREPPGLVKRPSLRREFIAAYRACVSFVDAQVGVVLDALDRADLWEDTVVVLLGDNGFHLGEHGGLFRKDTLFEGALHVPLIVVAPGVGHPGSTVSAPVELVDLYPTVVALAGLPAVPDIDGRSLVPLLEDPGAPGWETAFSYRYVQPPRRGWSLRTERARYTLWPDGSEELYDHTADPRELRNLADHDGLAALKARLRRQLEVRVATRKKAPAP